MNTTQSARSFDLFKLVVALILLAIIILLLLQRPTPAIVAGLAATSTPTGGIVASAPTHTSAPSLPAPTNTNPPPPSATPLPAQPSATATTQPTEAPSPAPTATLPPPTPTTASTEAPTQVPTQAPPETPAPTAANPNANCPLALTSRLAVGMKARVLSNLNLRSSPDITNNLIRTSPADTVLDVTGGPQCVPFQNGAYLWWEVRTPDGQTGWSAEGSLAGSYYFLEPVK